MLSVTSLRLELNEYLFFLEHQHVHTKQTHMLRIITATTPSAIPIAASMDRAVLDCAPWSLLSSVVRLSPALISLKEILVMPLSVTLSTLPGSVEGASVDGAAAV